MFVDTHAHLTDRAFDEDREEVIKFSQECLVNKIITSGFDIPSSFDALALAQKHEGVFASMGVYPENIYELDDDFESKFSSLAKDKKIVALGEIGLQYTPDMPDKDRQIEAFLRQLSLADKLNLPVVIHCRDAYGDMLAILREHKNLLNNGGTMHCYGGSIETAEALIRLGLHISVGGVSTFKNAQRLKEVLKTLPLQNLLLETDCPYLTPHPFRGKRNSPAFIPTIAQNLADIKGVTVEEVANVTTQNAEEVFRLC